MELAYDMVSRPQATTSAGPSLKINQNLMKQGADDVSQPNEKNVLNMYRLVIILHINWFSGGTRYKKEVLYYTSRGIIGNFLPEQLL